MPFLKIQIKYLNPIFHFIGIMGKKIINKLQQNKISIIDFLEEIKNLK